MPIKDVMPVIAKFEGDWVGNYIEVDIEGNVTDRHVSHFTTSFPSENEYHQVNRHKWDDGRYQEHCLAGQLVGKQIVWNTERINGSAWEVDEYTVIMRYTYKDDPAQLIYEFIQIRPNGRHRART